MQRIQGAVLACALAFGAVAQAQIPASVGYVESANVPLRFYYNSEENAALAATALTYAEEAWQRQIVQMGFATPYTVDDDMNVVEGAHFYLFASPGILAIPVPVAAVDSTPITDCAVVVRISDGAPIDEYPSLVAYGLNHAIQYSVDCIENSFAYESISTAVSMIEFPNQWFFPYVLADFQRSPDRSIDTVSPNDYFHFGAAFFPLFLDWYYSAGDGKLMAQMWDAVAQNGTVNISGGYATSTTPNEPDLLDAIDSVLANQDVSFAEAFARFSTYRYFVGAFADGEHFPGAEDWVDCEPNVDWYYSKSDLDKLHGTAMQPPAPLGVNYTVFNTAGAEPQSLRVNFVGDTTVRWWVTLVGIGAAGVTEQDMELDDAGRGSVMLTQAQAHNRYVMVVSNLGDGQHDADQPDTLYATYDFDAALLDCAELKIASVTPATVEPGGDVKVSVHGTGFGSDQAVSAAWSGSGVDVASAKVVSATELELMVHIADDADMTARDLSLTFECGSSASAAAIMTVASPPACGCTQANGHAPASAILCLLLIAAWTWRRRFVVARLRHTL